MATHPMHPAEREKRIIARAGLFVALGLIFSSIVVFLVGKEHNLFVKKSEYYSAFNDVGGLQLSSPVRLGGLNIGRISSISFPDDLEDKRILVRMEVDSRYAERLRSDSVAQITNQGILGDKAIDISQGSKASPAIPNKGEIATGTSGDIASLLKATGIVMDNVISITKELHRGIKEYASLQVHDDVVELITDVKDIANEIQGGRGMLHNLIYDSTTNDEWKRLLTRSSEAAAQLTSAATHLDGLLIDVKTSPGSLHALIYDKNIAQALVDLGAAAREISTLTRDATTSKTGALYQLVYGDAQTMLSDLARSASDVRAITKTIREGEGSLGGIIYDPTIYEDLKGILGTVKRNKILRALVRLSINNENATNKPKNP